MHSTRLKTPGIALAVLCTAFVLTLAAAKTVIAQSHVQIAEPSQEVSGIYVEQQCGAFVSQPLEVALAIAHQSMPATYATHRPQPEDMVHVELQVPAALLRTLWMEEESSRSIELHVPAALLATLSAEGRLQMPQRSPDPCRPFCSLY